MATDITSKASGQWDKLENIFEDRVAKALNKLGVPSAKDVAALSARVDALTKQAQATKPRAAAKPLAKKTAASPAKAAAPAAEPQPAAKKRAPARKKAAPAA